MEVYEIVFKIVHSLLFLFGILSNGFLIYLSIFKTPKSIRTYSVLILNQAITDFIVFIADTFTQARVIPTDPIIAYVSSGVCHYISAFSCVIGLSIQMHCFTHSLYLILICFAYRYLIIIRKVPSVKKLLLVVFLVNILSSIQTVLLIINSSDPEYIKKIAKERHPYYNFDGLTFNGYADMDHLKNLYVFIHVCLSPIPIYTTILILRSKIVNLLSMSATQMRKQTKEMHDRLLTALTVQAALPLLNIISLVIYIIGKSDLYHHPFLEHMSVTVVMIVPAVSPMVYLSIFGNIKNVFSVFSKNQNRRNSVQTLMEEYEIIFKVVHITLFSCGILFNGLLIYLSIFKTPKAIRTYSILILNHAITDFVVFVADFFTQARIIPTDWVIAFAFNGPCQYISSFSCVVGLSIQIHCFNHSLYLILICFTYRYLVIIRKVPSGKLLLLIVFLAYIPSFIQSVFLILNQSDPEVIEHIVRLRYPYYNLDGLTFNGYVNILRPTDAFAFVHSCLSPIPIYIGVLILRKKIIHVLDKTADHMSKQTREMHDQLLKVLTIQALLPFLNFFAVAIYFTGQFDLYHHPFLEYINLTVVQIVPAVTPLVSFVYIRSYQQTILRVFDKNVRRRFDVSPAPIESIYQEETKI